MDRLVGSAVVIEFILALCVQSYTQAFGAIAAHLGDVFLVQEFGKLLGRHAKAAIAIARVPNGKGVVQVSG